MKYTDLRCVGCGMRPTPAITDASESTPPSDAVIFTTHGNCGSRLYDEPPASPNYIAVIVCDNCLKLQSAVGNVMHVRPLRTVVSAVKVPWDPADAIDYYD